MILTSLPDLPPQPATLVNAEFRRNFYARWGRENAIVCGHGRAVEYAVLTQTLSIKRVCGGAERFYLRERELAVDDDNYLVLNQGQRYGSRLHGTRPVFSFALFFRPGLVEEVARSRAQSLDVALNEARSAAAAPTVEFGEHLRAHDAYITPRLDALRDAVLAGERSELWLEQEALALADALLLQERGRCKVGDARRVARAELRRRLHLAADRIESTFDQALTLDELAATACLSRWHFVRQFNAEFGLPPHAYLTRKRARAALRLLAQGEHDREWVAQRCGLGSRFALRRALARWAPPGDRHMASDANAAQAATAQDPHTNMAPAA